MEPVGLSDHKMTITLGVHSICISGLRRVLNLLPIGRPHQWVKHARKPDRRLASVVSRFRLLITLVSNLPNGLSLSSYSRAYI